LAIMSITFNHRPSFLDFATYPVDPTTNPPLPNVDLYNEKCVAAVKSKNVAAST